MDNIFGNNPNTGNEDFFNNSKQDIFAAENASPFNQGGGFSGGGNGGSIWDQPNANPFGQPQQPQQQNNGEKPIPWNDPVELICFYLPIKILKIAVQCVIGGFTTLKEAFEILTVKTGDSFMDMLKVMAVAFGPFALLSVVLIAAGLATETTLAFMGATTLTGSLLNILLCVIGFLILKAACYKSMTKEQIEAKIDAEVAADPNKQSELNEIVELGTEYGESFDSIMDDILNEDENKDEGEEILSEDFNTTGGDDDFFSVDNNNTEEESGPKEVQSVEVSKADGALISSKWLWDKFNPIFPEYQPNYSDTETWDEGSEQFDDIRSVVFNAFKDLYGCESLDDVVNDIELKMKPVINNCMYTKITIEKPAKGKPIPDEKVTETLYSYEEQLIEKICDRKVLYTGQKAIGNRLGISTKLKGNRYEVVISKPNKQAIYLGDVFNREEIQEIFKTSKNMPFVIGVDDLGTPVYAELCEKASEQYFTLIGGGPGTGKSFLMNGIIMQLAAFNQPKDIQFIFIDPKGQDYGKFSVLPHTLKILNGSNSKEGGELYYLLKYINEVEYARRSALFREAGVNNIQSYKKKGKEMPYLYIVIEEYVSVTGQMWPSFEKELNDDLKATAKENKEKFIPVDVMDEMKSLLQAGVTRWRTSGIFLTIVSHRFTGTVDKMARMNASMRIVLKNEDTKKECFDPNEIKENPKALRNTGDFALKIGQMSLLTGKTIGITTDDDEEASFIKQIASAYYKMGVDMPTDFLKSMREYADRKDYDDIREKLNFDDSVDLSKYENLNPEAKNEDAEDEAEELNVEEEDIETPADNGREKEDDEFEVEIDEEETDDKKDSSEDEIIIEDDESDDDKEEKTEPEEDPEEKEEKPKKASKTKTKKTTPKKTTKADKKEDDEVVEEETKKEDDKSSDDDEIVFDI